MTNKIKLKVGDLCLLDPWDLRARFRIKNCIGIIIAIDYRFDQCTFNIPGINSKYKVIMSNFYVDKINIRKLNRESNCMDQQ